MEDMASAPVLELRIVVVEVDDAPVGCGMVVSVMIVLIASSLVVDDAIVEVVESEPPLAWQASPVVHSLDRSTRGMSLDKKAMVIPLSSNLV